MIMRVVALFNTPKAKFARLRAVGRAWYGHEAPIMTLLDVKNEERGLKLNEMVEVQFQAIPVAIVATSVPKLPESAILVGSGTVYDAETLATPEGLQLASEDAS